MLNRVKNNFSRLLPFGLNLRGLNGLFIFIFLVAVSCEKSLPTLDGINLREWKDDKNGCAGLREKVIDLVIQQKDKLLSLSETDIIHLLGKPDETELYKRSEKFYKYYFSSGPGCAGSGKKKSITLRFNAVGLLKEIAID